LVTGASDLPHHHWELTTPHLVAALAAVGPCRITVHDTPATLTPEILRAHHTVLLNYNGPRFPAAVERAIEEFVRAGGGFAAFHHCLYGTFYGMELDEQRRWRNGPGEGWEAYRQLIGATWPPANISHSIRHAFAVRWLAPLVAHPEGTEFTADDELYHRFDLLPAARVVATAYSDPARRGTGRDEPVAWTHSFGRGRTVFTTLGHDVKALSQPGVLRLFADALAWTATPH
jgi:hypothetical protein